MANECSSHERLRLQQRTNDELRMGLEHRASRMSWASSCFVRKKPANGALCRAATLSRVSWACLQLSQKSPALECTRTPLRLLFASLQNLLYCLHQSAARFVVNAIDPDLVGVALKPWTSMVVLLAVVVAAQPNRDVIRIGHLEKDELLAGDF